MAKVFDLWQFNSFVAPLAVALEEKNAEKSVELLTNMLAAAQQPWDIAASPLYHRMGKSVNPVDPKQLLPALLDELERDQKYAFLWGDDEFKSLLAQYRMMV